MIKLFGLYYLIALKMYNTDADILEQDNAHSIKIEDNIHTQIHVNNWL